MLASLLPGLREVRTPLAIGYVWLIGLWLLFADKVPMKVPAQDGLVRHVFEAGSFLGQGVLLTVVSFSAYLLGSLVKMRVPKFRRNYSALIVRRDIERAISVVAEAAAAVAGVMSLGVVGGSLLPWPLAFLKYLFYRRVYPPSSFYKALEDFSEKFHVEGSAIS
jgi:hypothetical protein